MQGVLPLLGALFLQIGQFVVTDLLMVVGSFLLLLVARKYKKFEKVKNFLYTKLGTTYWAEIEEDLEIENDKGCRSESSSEEKEKELQ